MGARMACQSMAPNGMQASLCMHAHMHVHTWSQLRQAPATHWVAPRLFKGLFWACSRREEAVLSFLSLHMNFANRTHIYQ